MNGSAPPATSARTVSTLPSDAARKRGVAPLTLTPDVVFCARILCRPRIRLCPATEQRPHELHTVPVRRRIVQCRIAALIGQIGIGASCPAGESRMSLWPLAAATINAVMRSLLAAFIHVGARLQQGAARLHVALLRSEKQRSETAFRAGASVGSMVDAAASRCSGYRCRRRPTSVPFGRPWFPSRSRRPHARAAREPRRCCLCPRPS